MKSFILIVFFGITNDAKFNTLAGKTLFQPKSNKYTKADNLSLLKVQFHSSM